MLAGAAAIALLIGLACGLDAGRMFRPSPELFMLSTVEIDRLRMHADQGRDDAALDRLRRAARQGNLGAGHAAASVLLARHDPAQVREGMQLVALAANENDAPSQYLLGKAYFDGVGGGAGAADRVSARTWLMRAAHQQHRQAMYLLGLIYKNGYGTPVNEIAAAAWFGKAAELGDANAMFMLGNAYQAGAGVRQSSRDAVRLYMQAAEQEHPLAIQTLSYGFRDGSLGLPQNERQASEFMLEVAHALQHPTPVN